MADIEKSIKLSVDTGGSIESLGRLRRELATLNADIEGADKGSAAFKNLESQIKKTESAIRKAEGAFGDASDKIKTLSGSSVERATASFGLLKEGITSLDFGKFKIGLQGVTGGFKALGGAIAATGIGAIVIGVTLLIQNFDKLAASGGIVGEVFTYIGDTITNIIDGITALSDAIGLTDTKAAAAQEAADARNKKALEDRLNLVDRVKSSYEKQIEVAKAAGKDTTDLEKKSADAQKQVLKTNIAYLENIAKQSTFFADLIEPVLKGQKTKLAELEQAEKVSSANRTKNAIDAEKERQSKLKELDQKYTQETEYEKIDRQEKAALEEAKRLRANEETKLKIVQFYQDQRNDLLAKETEAAFNEQVKQSEAEKKIAEEKEKQHQKDLQDLADETEAEFMALSAQSEAQKKAAEDEKKRNQELQDAKIGAISNGLSTISSLTELFTGKSREQQRKAFNIQKGVSIAQAGIATYESATKAFNSLAGIPVVGPALGGVAAAAAVAAGLLNIKKIASQKFEGGGDKSPSPSPSPSSISAGESTAGPSIAPPVFNLGGQQIGGASNMLGSGSGGFTQQPIKVFVSETDISNVQNKVQVTEGNSLFGSGG